MKKKKYENEKWFVERGRVVVIVSRVRSKDDSFDDEKDRCKEGEVM